MTEIEYRVTFGSGHSGPDHPRWHGADHHGWLRVDATDELIARHVLAAALGGAFSCIYDPDDDGYPRLGDPGGGAPDYYPHGQTGHLHAFRGPDGEAMWRWIRTTHGVWEGPVADPAVETAPAPMHEQERNLRDLVALAQPGDAPMAVWAIAEIDALRARLAALAKGEAR